jgi:alpha-L-fucosidase
MALVNRALEVTLRPILLLAAGLMVLSTAASQTRYSPDWESLDKRPTPEWFTDAKFGIFIHWGVYSVPAYAPVGKYAEWYWNALKQGPQEKGKPNPTFHFHAKTYGEDFPYFNFAPMFRAELFDPAHWADVFKKSGAKYVVLTSKHHDGFALWPSEHASKSWNRPWNSVAAGPKRDLLGDLGNAVRKQGLRMGFYYSLYEWYNPIWLSDRKRYVTEHMMPQFKDVVTRYKPAIIFSDGEWDMPSENWNSPELLAWLFNESPVREDVVINDRWGKETRHKHGGYYTTEYTAGLEKSSHPWEESRGMAHSYGYNRMETLSHYRSERELLLMLIDLVSRGGNLLLDIGPTGDGRIPVIMEERLIQIGRWLQRNGEAIYGTKPWTRTRQWSQGEIPKMESGQYMVRYEVTDYTDRKKPGQAVIDAFFTSKGSDVYAIVPRWPGGQLTLKDVSAQPNAAVSLLGGPSSLKFRASGNDLVIDVPQISPEAGTAQFAYVFKVTGIRAR